MTPLSDPEERAMRGTSIEEKWNLICNQVKKVETHRKAH